MEKQEPPPVLEPTFFARNRKRLARETRCHHVNGFKPVPRDRQLFYRLLNQPHLREVQRERLRREAILLVSPRYRASGFHEGSTKSSNRREQAANLDPRSAAAAFFLSHLELPQQRDSLSGRRHAGRNLLAAPSVGTRYHCRRRAPKWGGASGATAESPWSSAPLS